MRTITITVAVDVAGALAAATLTDNLYLFDDNRANGSIDQGTSVLKTRVKKDDRLLWLPLPFEPEVFASIHAIEVDARYCEPQRRTYTGSHVVYWEGVVKQDLEIAPYRLTFALGDPPGLLSSAESPSLIGDGDRPGRAPGRRETAGKAR